MIHSRQLAAIMFTDIEGYTTLMQQNEEKAILARDKHRRIFNSITEKHNGRILQYYGDGTLSVFDSAIDAVNCGIEMQLGFREDPVIPVRIGIHTGDILFREDEIIGDGVNVASRIESLAVSGSVFISDKVYDEIKNQDSIKTSFLNTFKLKNIDKPIEVYAISNEGLIVPKLEDIKGKTDTDLSSLPEKGEQTKSGIRKRISLAVTITAIIAVLLFIYLKIGTDSSPFSETEGKSIAVLAFDNMSGDPDQEYFSDGHHWRGVVLGYLGKFEEAMNSLERALEITEGEGLAYLDVIAVKIQMGKKEEALQEIKSGEYIDPADAARLYTLLEMPDEAIFWLEKAYRERSVIVATMKHWWIWDPLRDDPRFIEIYNRMNF